MNWAKEILSNLGRGNEAVFDWWERAHIVVWIAALPVILVLGLINIVVMVPLVLLAVAVNRFLPFTPPTAASQSEHQKWADNLAHRFKKYMELLPELQAPLSKPNDLAHQMSAMLPGKALEVERLASLAHRTIVECSEANSELPNHSLVRELVYLAKSIEKWVDNESHCDSGSLT